MKYIMLLLAVTQISYSQISKFSYTSFVERERDNKEIAHYVAIANTFKKCASVVIVDDEKKTITIARKYIAKNGEAIDEFENYNFVKDVAEGKGHHYYAVDLANKSYVEFRIATEWACIDKDCDGFFGCQKSTELTK